MAITFLGLTIIALPTRAQIAWQKYAGNPVTPAWLNDVDAINAVKFAYSPSVLYDSVSGEFKMWFASLSFGYGTSFTISHAVSRNGIDWFLYSRNPVLRPGPAGSFDSRSVTHPEVIKIGSRYVMYYMGDDTKANQIGLATSFDGIHWTKSSANPILPVVDNTWESKVCSVPKVCQLGSRYFLLYRGYDGANHRIGLAVSSDGIHWIKSPHNPVLTSGPPHSWDQNGALVNALLSHHGVLYLLYEGAHPDAYEIGLATSKDGVSWKKFAGNPVFKAGGAEDWDRRLSQGSLLYRDGILHYWYSGYGPQGNWQIGYASSFFDPDLIQSRSKSNAANAKLSVHQATFPSPSLEGNYSISVASHVIIQVFNWLGEPVATLVDGVQPAGNHRIMWDAAEAPPGVYRCRLEAGGTVLIRKFVVAR